MGDKGIPDGVFSMDTSGQLGSMGHGEYDWGVVGANVAKLGCDCSEVALDGSEEERKGDL